MGISGFLGARNIGRLKIDLQFPEEIFAKTEIPIKIKLENTKKYLPSFLLRIEIDNRFQKNTVVISYIKNSSTEEIHIPVKFNNRGVHRIDKIKICSVFPFNFFIRCKFYKIDKKIIVFPKPVKCKFLSVWQSKSSRRKGESISNKIGYGGDIIGIRNYIYGDPIKYVHWKATAKTGELKVKEFLSLEFQPTVIDLNSLDGNLERKLSCATYLILQFYKTLTPFGLKIGKKVYKPELSLKNKRKLLKILAMYGS